MPKHGIEGLLLNSCCLFSKFISQLFTLLKYWYHDSKIQSLFVNLCDCSMLINLVSIIRHSFLSADKCSIMDWSLQIWSFVQSCKIMNVVHSVFQVFNTSNEKIQVSIERNFTIDISFSLHKHFWGSLVLRLDIDSFLSIRDFNNHFSHDLIRSFRIHSSVKD